jgi:hypothetical protein
VCAFSSRRCRGTGSGLLVYGTTLLPLTVSLTTLLLHRDLLRGQQRGRVSVAGLMVLPEFPMEVGQLLVKLTPGLGELVEACPALGVSGAVAWCRLRVGGAARGLRHANKTLVHGVMRGRSRCPPGHCGVGGGAGGSQRVHVGRHRVIREAWLSMEVHRDVPLHELPQESDSAPLA